MREAPQIFNEAHNDGNKMMKMLLEPSSEIWKSWGHGEVKGAEDDKIRRKINN